MSPVSDTYYPPPAFYFSVTVVGSATAAAALTSIDASFAEISGMRAEFQTEEVAEGGENRFVHRLPKSTRYSNLVMKRGIVTGDSFLAEWVGQTVGSGMQLPILPQNLLVALLNSKGIPSIAWIFVNAWPVKWEVASLNATTNDVLTETLEFSYNFSERINLGSAAALAAKMAQISARYG